MANIKVKDLNSLIQDLSGHELELQGGCGRTFTIRLPNGLAIMGMDKCAPFPTNTPSPF
jgi:hypothetical protein